MDNMPSQSSAAPAPAHHEPHHEAPHHAAPAHHETPHHEAPKMEHSAPMHFDAKDVADNKIMAALSYIGILFLVPLLAKKDSKFAQEHAKQGLVLCIAYVALMVIGIIPILGWIVSFVGSIALLVLDIIALVKCLGGEFYEIPVVGKYRKEFKI